MSDASDIVNRLLETDEVDPKEFLDRVHLLDVTTLRDEVQAKVPGLVVPVIHAMNTRAVGVDSNQEEQELWLYIAKEPVDDNGFNPSNYPSIQEQRQVWQVLQDWVHDHFGFSMTIDHKDTHAMYKKVAQCLLVKLRFRTEKGVKIVGHQNDETSETVSTRRGVF